MWPGSFHRTMRGACVRRYADVVVHRLLSASLGLIQLPAQVRLTYDSDIWSMRFTNLNLMPKHLKVHDLSPSPSLLVTQSHEGASHGRSPQRLAAAPVHPGSIQACSRAAMQLVHPGVRQDGAGV